MPKLTLGEGTNTKEVEVDDSFLKLTPEEQQATANDIAKQLGISSAPPPATEANKKDENWRTAEIAPIAKKYDIDKEGRMHDTGEWRWAVPNFVNSIIDAIQLPGDVMRGEVNPSSEEGFERTMNLAMSAVGGKTLSGGPKVAGKLAKPGEVMSETIDQLPGKAAAPKAVEQPISGARMGNEIPVAKTDLAPTAPTAVDQALDAWFKKQELKKTEGQATGKLVAEKLTPEPDLPLTVDMQIKQAERAMDAARGKDIREFSTQAKRTFGVLGKEDKFTAFKDKLLQNSRAAITALDDPEKVQKFMDKVADLKVAADDAEFATASGKKVRAGAMDKIFEVWVNALLSGPQTHATNILSNSLVNLWGLGENVTAAALSKITGSGISMREAKHRAIGNFEAIGDALRAAGASFRTERDLFEGAGQLESRRVLRSIEGPIGRYVRLPGRALTAEDSFFKTLAYRQEIDGLAVRNAVEEGLTGKQLARRIQELKANPTDEMMSSAEAFAKKQTFTNGLGPQGRYLQAALQESKGLKFILPFFRTPVNLLKYSAERTPAAFLMKQARHDLMGRNGAIKRDQAWARMTMGSAIAAFTMYKAAQGQVTGGGPSNQNERRLWYAEGNQPYSIRVGDNWYSYSRLEPLGTILGIAGDLQTLGSEVTEKEYDDIAALIVGSITRNLANKTWLRGPVEVAEVFGDSDRYAESYVQKMLGTLVPSAVAQYARTQDPYLREAEGILDGIKERIPGYRETLAITRDVFGNPIKSEGGLGPDLVSPIYTKAAKNDKTIAEMMRLKVYPGRIEKSIQGVDLTPEEWDFYTQATGQATKKFLDSVVGLKEYPTLPDSARQKLLQDTIRKARDVGRTAVKAKFKDLLIRIAQKKHEAELLGKPAPAPSAIQEQ